MATGILKWCTTRCAANNAVMGGCTLDKLITWGGVSVWLKVCTGSALARGCGSMGSEERAQELHREMKRVTEAAGSGMCELKALTGISTRFPCFLCKSFILDGSVARPQQLGLGAFWFPRSNGVKWRPLSGFSRPDWDLVGLPSKLNVPIVTLPPSLPLEAPSAPSGVKC